MVLPIALGVAAFGLVVTVIGASARVRDERIGAAVLALGCAMAFLAQLAR